MYLMMGWGTDGVLRSTFITQRIVAEVGVRGRTSTCEGEAYILYKITIYEGWCGCVCVGWWVVG